MRARRVAASPLRRLFAHWVRSYKKARSSRRARYEPQRHRIHAITQSRRPRAVVEHMAKMTVAACAVHRRAFPSKAVVAFLDDIFLGNGLPETGPSRAGIELGGRVEQCRIASGAPVQAWDGWLFVLPAEGALGTFAAQTLLDTKLTIGKLRGQVHRYFVSRSS